jgi:hypothetical protein
VILSSVIRKDCGPATGRGKSEFAISGKPVEITRVGMSLGSESRVRAKRMSCGERRPEETRRKWSVGRRGKKKKTAGMNLGWM